MISKQAKYALRALIGLARAEPGRAVLTADLASQQRIPKKFLEQILLLLKRSGLVQSRRGALGGYVLIKAPEEIRFLDVLRLVDGPIAQYKSDAGATVDLEQRNSLDITAVRQPTAAQCTQPQ